MAYPPPPPPNQYQPPAPAPAAPPADDAGSDAGGDDGGDSGGDGDYQDVFAYQKFDGHIGCNWNGKNLGVIGSPKDILNDVPTKCTDGGDACIELGKRACEAKSDCWGFALQSGENALDGVQVYNSSASNNYLCNGKWGLSVNSGWTTYRKINGNM